MLLDISADIAKEPDVITSENRESITGRCPQGVHFSEGNESHSGLWFPMRVTYSRELKAKELLDSLNIESFIPMIQTTTKDNGKYCIKESPAIHNLIFIKSSQFELNSIKSDIEHKIPLRYIIDKATKKPMTVPEKQMSDFIRVSKALDCDIIHLEYSEFLAVKGDKIRVMEGVFAGIEGVILRIKRNKKVVVSITGVAAVAIAYIPSYFLQKI